MVLNNDAKRLLVYFFYDGDGVVDKYVPYLLDDLTKHVKDTIIVVNGKLNEEGKKTFNQYTEQVIVRDNKGLDVFAYKAALDSLGWNKLAEYDEIILMNMTIMGPVYPFSEMFEVMNKKDLDFWGITEFFQTEDDPFGTMPEGYIPDHIQSHFIVVRNSLLTKDEFHDYWDKMPMIDGYLDSITKHETRFTKHFEKLGYKWEVYCDCEDYRYLTFNPVMGIAKKIVAEKRCPIFKRRSFKQDYTAVLNESCGEEAFELFKYLRDETDFDTDMLLDNLIRVENQTDIKKNMQWNYILPAYNCENPQAADNLRIALCMHIYFKDLIEECAEYAKNMPENADFFITTDTIDKKEEIIRVFSQIKCGRLDVRVVPNRGRDVGPWLVEFQDYVDQYDYVCRAHDKKTGQLKPGSVGHSFTYKCFENVLKSKEYVLNIINTFEKNKKMGMLCPPPPNHADFFITLGIEWGPNFGVTKELAEELEIKVPMTEKKEPIAPLGSFYWARGEALKPLFRKRWSYEDFPKEPAPGDGTILHGIERIMSYVAQEAGFYPGWVLSEEGAAIEITNLTYMIKELNNIIFYTGQDAGSFHQTLMNLKASYERLRDNSVSIDNSQAKLYYSNSTEPLSEERAYNLPVVGYRTNGSGPEADIVQDYSIKFDTPVKMSMIRFDQKDFGKFIMKDLNIKVTEASGNVNEISIREYNDTNGIILPDGIAFMVDDPQILFTMKKDRMVKEIAINSVCLYSLPDHFMRELTNAINDPAVYKKNKKLFKK